MRARSRWVLNLALSAALLALLLWTIEPGRISGAVQAADGLFLALAALVVLANRALMAWKWNLLLRTRAVRISWLEALRIYYVATFFGLFLPPTVGADTLRALAVSRRGHSLSRVVSSILVERFLGLVNLFLFGAFGGLLLAASGRRGEAGLGSIVPAALFLGALAAAGFVFSLTAAARRGVTRGLEALRRLPVAKGLAGRIGRLYESYSLYRDARGVLGGFFLLTSLETLTAVLRCALVGLALGIAVPFDYYLAFVPLSLLVIRLPISFAGFGVTEGTAVYFLALRGVERSLAFGLGLTDHGLNLLAGAVPGAFLYWWEHRCERGRRRHSPPRGGPASEPVGTGLAHTPTTSRAD